MQKLFRCWIYFAISNLIMTRIECYFYARTQSVRNTYGLIVILVSCDSLLSRRTSKTRPWITSILCSYHIYAPLGISVHLCITQWPISLSSASVSSRLDSVLFGCPQKHAVRLQRVQQAPVRVVTQLSSCPLLKSTELLKQFHWRIWFKLASLVYRVVNTGHPPYLTDLLQYHKSARSTRPAFICQSLTPYSATQPFIWHSLHLCWTTTISQYTQP